MKVTQVNIEATHASRDAGRPSLTPELLAATGARYSRSNDGLEAILAKIDPENPDKSVDSIFKMVDYGHASIADMAPVAMFMDGISMWLAYHIWSLCPLAGGQESSTRYIKLSMDNLPTPGEIGIPEAQHDQWLTAMQSAFEAYEKALVFWEGIAQRNPEVLRIPKTLLEDTSEKAGKQVARMKRNYAFDRARYFLPAALKTNVMMIQSARAWVALCQQLLSHPLPEAQKLGEQVRAELALVAPRLIRHAAPQESFQKGIESVLRTWQVEALDMDSFAGIPSWKTDASPTPSLEVFAPHEAFRPEDDLKFHSHRYAHMGDGLQRAAVRFSWGAVAFGDIRDLNRHRTGTKFCPLVPQGFYAANDQTSSNQTLQKLSEEMAPLLDAQFGCLLGGAPTSVYWILLGTQFEFEHTTTANHFIYEAELRTGVGAHYRYAKHLHDVLELWYQKFPETRGLILEGSAEPE